MRKREKWLINKKNFGLSVLFDPRDIWIGVFWNREKHMFDLLAVYICFIPMFPIKLGFDVEGLGLVKK